MIEYFDAVIIGAGPAGLGPVVHAMKNGLINDFLNQRILIVEKSEKLGTGDLGNHIINSDTPASVFLEVMDGQAAPYFARILNTPHAQAIVASGNMFVPLSTAGKFLEDMGDEIENTFRDSSVSDIRRKSSVNKLEITEDGSFILHIYDHKDERYYTVSANKVVLACGARQRPVDELNSVYGCNVNLNKYPVILSNDFLKGDAVALELIQKINNGNIKHISILGSSHSAFSSALVICKRISPDVDVKIDLLYRREPKVFYPSAEEAVADDYTDFGEDDICPNTKRVYRFAGLRMESRDLLRSMLNLGNTKKDSRLNLLKIEDENIDQLHSHLSASDLVIVAFGYDFLAVPVFDSNNNPIPLGDQQNIYVDKHCRLLTRDGNYIPNLYGIGLASGYVPDSGGEKSFCGQTNSLWIYQNPAGKIIFDALRETP